MTSDPRDEVQRSDTLERAARELHRKLGGNVDHDLHLVIQAFKDVREADAAELAEMTADRDRLAKEVERLTAMVNTTIRGCNQGHLIGEPLP